MNKRKLTIEIVVDQDSTDWHWVYETMKLTEAYINGICVRSISNDWTTERAKDALMEVNNWLARKEHDRDE